MKVCRQAGSEGEWGLFRRGTSQAIFLSFSSVNLPISKPHALLFPFLSFLPVSRSKDFSLRHFFPSDISSQICFWFLTIQPCPCQLHTEIILAKHNHDLFSRINVS